MTEENFQDHWQRHSEREWVLIQILQWEMPKWGAQLKWAQRFSYELGVEPQNLFYFCRWLDRTYPKEAMEKAIDYQLEYSVIYEPYQDLGLLKNGKVTKDNLFKVLPFCIKFETKLKGGDWAWHFAKVVCGCYGMDGPWIWHMQRALRKADKAALGDPENCKVWVEWYVDLVNKTEKEFMAETGETISSLVLRSEDRRELE